MARQELQASSRRGAQGRRSIVLANKQDQKGALGAKWHLEALGLPDVRNRQWSIQETCATKGKGLSEGFDWLVACIKGE